jgi:hypothetical protein
MPALLDSLKRTISLSLCLLAAFCLITSAVLAQQPQARITGQIDNLNRVTLKGTQSPMARAENDAGRVPVGTKFQGMNIVFSRTAAQEADLQELLAAQQNLSSPLYHKWLTPDEFAARFGMADSDIAAVKLWLEQQGFSVDGVARSKNRMAFSGTAGQVEAAFGIELHYYNLGAQKHFAPSSDLNVPAALASAVQNVWNLSSFRPHSRLKFRTPQRVPKANFTSSQTGEHFLTPKDVATIYDINAAYSAGYTGAGQSIAVVGQSLIAVSDIENFQTAAGFTTKDPTLLLVPDSGTATTVTSDEAESDIDLEYSSTIGKGATIFFVYVGDNSNYSVWDSIQYAVDNDVAPIISDSYGACETALGSSDYTSLNAILAQAASQGQTVLGPAGDDGSTDCYGDTSLSTTQQEALAVDFPASSQYVTGMGGSEFLAADVASTNTTYWEASSGSDLISSALSYIPEQAWNDDSSSSGLSAGGGGISTLTARPSWQSGVTGISAGSYRLVPDISLSASPDNAGYLYCSSDSSTGVTGSCSNGFRDSSDTYLTVAGGTSFGGPIFAGMLSLLNQKLNSTGQGVINATLYSLAANSTTYSEAFHDITSGNNECTAGATYCSTSGASEYSAGTGYDEATGLGSIDFYNLMSAWPSGATLIGTTTTLSAASNSPATGASDVVNIVVASSSSSVTATPTGTLTLLVDGTEVTSSLALSSGSATYTFSSATSGTHTIKATYSGNSTYASSTGTLVLTVGSSSGGFTVSATSVTVAAGSSGTSTVTVTPANGYTGTIAWSVSSSPSISNACFVLPNTTISGTSAATATLTVYTSSTSCSSAAVKGSSGKRKAIVKSPIAFREDPQPPSNSLSGRMQFAMAGLLLAGLIGYRPRRFGAFGTILFLAAMGFALSGCSGLTTSSTSAAQGTYTLTITGTETTTSTITASTTITLTVN